MTKSEYRAYISSEKWRSKRSEFLDLRLGDSCSHCGIPRWLAVVAYDQDFHVHHKNYSNVGNEDIWNDLEALCKRCHEVKHFGSSNLHKPLPVNCINHNCKQKTWDVIDRTCEVCSALCIADSLEYIKENGELEECGYSSNYWNFK